jgi:hypothetical protein
MGESLEEEKPKGPLPYRRRKDLAGSGGDAHDCRRLGSFHIVIAWQRGRGVHWLVIRGRPDKLRSLDERIVSVHFKSGVVIAR